MVFALRKGRAGFGATPIFYIAHRYGGVCNSGTVILALHPKTQVVTTGTFSVINSGYIITTIIALSHVGQRSCEETFPKVIINLADV